MKKTLAFLLIASVAAGIVAGCSKPADDTATTPDASATSAAPMKDKTPKMNDTE